MSALIPSHPARRWYDEVPTLARAVHLSRALPPDIRARVARHLNEAIDARRFQERNRRQPLSLGRVRVLGLYRAAERRRWYDAESHLRRAYTMMGAMSPHVLDDFAERMLRVAQLHAVQARGPLSGEVAEALLMKNTRENALVDDRGDLRLVSGDYAHWPALPEESPPPP